jgi:uncharacterized protein YecE (DUF72 family)
LGTRKGTAQLRLGTCSWSTKDWVGSVYTQGTKPAEYIREYATHFDTVEIDSTFYAVPRRSTIEGWRDRTPESFVFAAKAPQVITHEKLMKNCERDATEFLDAMSLLGDRLGPIVFQFPYYAKRRGVTVDEFVSRLDPFLGQLPKDQFRFVVEVRNKTWYSRQLLDVLGNHGVTLAFIEHPWMWRSDQLHKREGLFTGPFAYIRWLGDRKGIEEITKTWSEPVVDRQADLARWVPLIKNALDNQMDVFGYVNNHYSGHAPGDVYLLRELMA